jgi:hypothetical protein
MPIRMVFQHIVGFTARAFHPYLTSPFLIKLLDQHLIRRRDNMAQLLEAVLPQEVELGAHSGVVLLQNGKVHRFIWTHVVIRPWGFDVGPQCSSCRVLKPWEANWVNGDIVLKCKWCGESSRFRKPSDMRMLGDVAQKSSAGCWGLITRTDTTHSEASKAGSR